jgi:xylan 1,4-beta-xylosidase
MPLMVVGAGRANEGLRVDWLDQLSTVQQEIGFRYIRMHGVLDDDMGVYSEDKQGNPVFNFQYVDVLYDHLLKLHIRPFVELSFMPSMLASGKETVFWWRGNITPPKDPVRWHNLISAFTRHMVERYGESEVEQWYFEVWNEPDLRHLFFSGSMEDYLDLYRNTAMAVKEACSTCRVGGPADAGSFTFEKGFEDYLGSHPEIPADFISAHTYGVTKGFLDTDGSAGTILDPSAGAVVGRMRHSRQMLLASSRPGLELHFSEWSSSYTPTDFLHDQYGQASFILDKIRNAGASVDSMSYWTFTDIFEELGPPTKPFHGGFGLLNLQGIRKPSFFAYKFLSALGEEDLATEDSKGPTLQSWVTRRKDGSIQMLVWDYSPQVPPTGQTDQSFYRKEVPATPMGAMRCVISHLGNGNYSETVYRVGYKKNDAYTAYLRMGAPSSLSPQQVDILNSKANGNPESRASIRVLSNTYTRDLPFRSNDVLLVVLTPEP